VAGSADTSKVAGSGSRTQHRDTSGRLTGTQTTNGSPSGIFTGTQRDASGRLTGSVSVSGKCQDITRIPVPPMNVKK
jgi:YD repeat-containing protein